MKTLFTITLFLIQTLSHAQNNEFKGHLYIEDSLLVSGGIIIFPLTKDTLQIENSDTAIIDLNNSKHRVFYFLWSGWKSKIFRFDSNQSPLNIQKINVPDYQFYKKFEEKKVCPICLKSEFLIPLIYGMPTKKMMKEAKRGKFAIAGCIIHENSPKYYCKLDHFEF